ncbi:hypothetical protein KC332_g6443 [Hortaea werneckii]|uniref:Uncharacterized protein n=1 Tax=Hortaea werneckii TaxID=91943 RepID=A0A3M7HWA2_HORWE|nr:hypothetical protein KC358_g6189 [Hortaea werneckii]KAI6840119.1 hypothetical protein KC350_g5511 [Hortaea werneckii]KAI6934555.1 hypothetical protein KC348_g6469 [Hortaea werneckii]KAI6936820.1 hypothetical protein KC341_g5994 [Hortaea werneckii]KAI6972185.1 hypothetical protein KC321_g6377 [Hortaea werneckii]
MTQYHTNPTTLQSLPAELRVRIYDYIFTNHSPWILLHIYHDVYNLDLPIYLNLPPPGSLGVMRTSQQLYEETSAHLYGSTNVSVCLRASTARAHLKSSSCLGTIDQVRFWPFISHLTLTLELLPRMDPDVFIKRLTCFLRAIRHGENLKTVVIRLSSDEDDRMPDCLEEIVKALCTGLSVQGQVIVAFDYDADEQSEYERQLADRITTAIST